MKLLKNKSESVVKEVGKSGRSESGKNATAKEAKAAAGKPLLRWISQPTIFIIIFIVAAALLMENLVIKDVEQRQQSQIKKILSASVKQNFDNYIKGRVREINALAETEWSTQSLNDKQEVQSLPLLIKSMFADLDQLYFVPQTKLQNLSSINPELSFASLDFIQRAASGEAVAAEAFFHQDAWKFQIAAPVLSKSGEADSYVLAIFNTSSIKRLLIVPHGAPFGLVSLSSSHGSKRNVVLGQGSGNSKDSVSVDTIVAQWQIRYSPEAGGLPNLDRTLVWIIFATTGVVLALLVFLLCRSNGLRVRRDLIAATKYLRSVLLGETQKKPKGLYFAEIHSMASAVAQAGKEQLKQNNATLNSASAVQQEGVEETPVFDDSLLDDEVLSEAGLQPDPLGVDIQDEEGNEDEEELDSFNVEVSQSIFRAYDIRGVVDETLNEAIVEMIGKALASEALSLGLSTLCVGYDGRLSNTSYCDAITRGIVSTGVEAIIVGQVPTPTLYFATHHFETGSGVMITGSHNPSNYNGFKMMLGGNTLSGEDIQKLYNRILLKDFAEGQGARKEQSVDREYLDTILNDIAVAAPLKVVLDAGNGVAGGLAPTLIEELGCEVIPLFCEVDGNFPNHHPDPGKPENLQDLIAAVKEHDADIGLAFDGDGDRIGVVTNTGKIIWPDRLLMLFAKDVVSRNPGADIIFDVKCSRRLNGLISSYGGRPVMWKTGHSLIKAKMKETGALLAGEMSGHMFFKERWFGFDDGLYSAARLLEILGTEDRSSDEVFADFPEDVSTPEINVTVTDESKFEIIEKLCALKDKFTGGNASTIDGLRVDYPSGWGLCRASNTTPVLVLRFEADDENSLEEIKEKFKVQLSTLVPGQTLDF